MKLAVYSVITNDYDTPKSPSIRGVKHYLFTDNPDVIAPGWEIVEIDKTDDQRLQRKIKILGHPLLDEYDVTIYVDGSIQLLPRIKDVLRRYRSGMVIGKHPRRNCVYAEGLEVKRQEKAPPALVDAQIMEYFKANYPANNGMWDSCILIRDKSCKEMNELWHKKLEEHSHRDQLSLPWALWKHPVRITAIPVHSYAKVSNHKKREVPKIHYISPFRSDKNIGKANNDEISLYNNDDWVCLTDADAMPMLPDFGKQIEDIVMAHGDQFGLIGCMTNRLGGLHQCYNGKFSDDMDMRNHYKIALELRETNGNEVVETTGVAGLFMLFKVDTWRRAGGFVEKDFKADTYFNKAVKKIGLKIGLATGLYFFHGYRIWQSDHKKAWGDTTHLR